MQASPVKACEAAYQGQSAARRRVVEVILYCARASVGAPLAGVNPPDLTSEMDWALLTDLAAKHHMVPLVYRELCKLLPDAEGHAGLQNLAMAYLGIKRRNCDLTAELLQVLNLFQQHKIPAIPIKGPTLAVSAFGDVFSRQFGDLDLLLRLKDMPLARELIKERGYRPEFPINPATERAYIRLEHSFPFVRTRDKLAVELHWRLQDRYMRFAFSDGDLWSGACHAELLGRDVLSLSPEHLFLFLCMHGAKHHWEKLEWICCLPALMRRNPGLRWASVIDMARRLRGVRILHLGLLLAHQLEGTELTRKPLSLLKTDRIAEDLAATVWRNLFRRLDSTQREPYRFRFCLKAREKLRDRLGIVLLMSFRLPHPESSVWKRVHLPAPLLPLHYILGPLRKLKRYGLRGLSGLINPKKMSLHSHHRDR
jgi:hypothetical protein